MDDDVDPVLDTPSLTDVAHFEIEPWVVEECPDTVERPSAQVVYAQHRVAAVQQPSAQMRSDEACSSGHNRAGRPHEPTVHRLLHAHVKRPTTPVEENHIVAEDRGIRSIPSTGTR